MRAKSHNRDRNSLGGHGSKRGDRVLEEKGTGSKQMVKGLGKGLDFQNGPKQIAKRIWARLKRVIQTHPQSWNLMLIKKIENVNVTNIRLNFKH